jgi:hypothetical protein
MLLAGRTRKSFLSPARSRLLHGSRTYVKTRNIISLRMTTLRCSGSPLKTRHFKPRRLIFMRYAVPQGLWNDIHTKCPGVGAPPSKQPRRTLRRRMFLGAWLSLRQSRLSWRLCNVNFQFFDEDAHPERVCESQGGAEADDELGHSRRSYFRDASTLAPGQAIRLDGYRRGVRCEPYGLLQLPC